MTIQIAVCGPRDCTEAEAAAARRVGELLAEQQVVVICGGGTGVMAAVAAGARARGGLVIGIRPNDSRDGASPICRRRSSPTWARPATRSSCRAPTP